MAEPTTADAIVRCAQTSIIAGGYHGFSFATIADVVGIRKASIHHHFPTKADLVLTLVRQYRREAEEGFAAIEHNVSDPADQLRAYTGYWESCIGEAESSYCVCALLATQISVLPDDISLELRAYFRTLSGWLEAVLNRGAEQGSFILANDAHSEAETLMATVHGAMLSARAYGDPNTFAAITRPAIDRLLTPR